MDKKKLAHYAQMAYDEGMNDTELDDQLDSNAQHFMEQEVTGKTDMKQRAVIHEAYKRGFLAGFGKAYLRDVIKELSAKKI